MAPRLQAGLQRFAKPWWRRQVRFTSSVTMPPCQCESALSGRRSPTPSTTLAWLVLLLLSPEAAESEWVDREVEYWLEHKDPNRIIPVVTDGEFTWAQETDIDPDFYGGTIGPFRVRS